MQCMGSSSSQEKKAHRPNKERFLCIEREEKISSEQTQTFDSDCLTSCYVSHMDFFFLIIQGKVIFIGILGVFFEISFGELFVSRDRSFI